MRSLVPSKLAASLFYVYPHLIIDLEHAHFNETSSELLVSIIQNASAALRHLFIGNCQVSANHFKLISRALPSSSLTAFHYFGVVTTVEGRSGIRHLLNSIGASNLSTFQFNDCGQRFDHKIMAELVSSLKNNSQLKNLWLPCCQIEDKSAEILARVLPFTNITDLNLQANRIGTEGASALLSYALGSQLIRLNLLDNDPFPAAKMTKEFKLFLRKVNNRYRQMYLMLDMKSMDNPQGEISRKGRINSFIKNSENTMKDRKVPNENYQNNFARITPPASPERQLFGEESLNSHFSQPLIPSTPDVSETAEELCTKWLKKIPLPETICSSGEKRISPSPDHDQIKPMTREDLKDSVYRRVDSNMVVQTALDHRMNSKINRETFVAGITNASSDNHENSEVSDNIIESQNDGNIPESEEIQPPLLKDRRSFLPKFDHSE